MASLLTLEEAQERILAAARPLPAELVPIVSAAGRVAAEEVRARVDLPPFASSAMDGFAVRSADLPAKLETVGESAAGSPYEGRLEAGQAVAISTGAVVPEGADAVAPVEHVVRHDNEVEVPGEAAQVGANVRRSGSDLAAGDVVVPAGVLLTPGRVAAAAAAGLAAVSCGRRPRVSVLATGSELVAPGEPLGPGEIYEANGLMLGAALAAGAEVVPLPTVADDEITLRKALERGLGTDVLVTSGGVSVGEHDLVRAVERDLGVEEIFWRVSIKPGKPVSFGARGATLVFGLPGNPVSALVCCELFVKPALRALQGLADPRPRYEPGRLSAGLRRNDERDEFVRARSQVDGEVIVLEPLVGQESHMIGRSSAADALVHVPRGNGELAAGSTVRWIRL